MASSYRRLLLLPPLVPVGLPPPTGDDYKLPPPPLKKSTHHSRKVACTVIVAALVFAVLSMVIARYFIKRRAGNRSGTRSPSRNPPILFDTQEDFVDEEHGPQLDHPIWYIRTVGLDRSVIESITVFRYKPGEGLIEGTECSVCLGEFSEDESLRLLPKCSHAFHVPCIDTWLASHKNCPLCRAPIVRADGTEQLSLEVPIVVSSGPNGTIVEESLHSRGISASSSDLSLSRIGELGAGENGIEDSNFGSPRVEDGGKASALPELGKSGLRVVSDLGDHLRAVGDRIQPVRRSVSMDSPSASEIYHAVAVAMCDQSRGASKRQAPKMKSSSLSTDKIRRSGSGGSSLYRMVKSCSFGASLRKEPVSMKRSFSSSANVRALGQ